MLKVVCAYTYLHPFCEASLEAHAPQVEYTEMGYRHDDYHRFLDGLWRAGDTFLLIEHDIEIHATVASELESCPEPWCVFEYAVSGGTMLDASLGCTRFRSSLLQALPNFMGDLPVRDWRRLDCEMAPRLHQAGYRQHVHYPPVKHHHRRETGMCDCQWEHHDHSHHRDHAGPGGSLGQGYSECDCANRPCDHPPDQVARPTP